MMRMGVSEVVQLLGAAIVFPWKNAACQSARVPECHRRSTVLSSVQILATGQSLFTHRPHHGRPDQCVGGRIVWNVVWLSVSCGPLHTLRILDTLHTLDTLDTAHNPTHGFWEHTAKTQTEHKQLALAPLEPRSTDWDLLQASMNAVCSPALCALGPD